MTLTKLDATLKTLAGGAALLAGSTYAGFIPPTMAIILGLAAVVLAFLAGSPLFDPSLVGKTPVVSRFLLTIAGLCGAAAGSSFFPEVQHLFAADHAKKIAAGLTLLGGLCTYLAQSPIIAGGTVGAGGAPAKLVLLLAFLGLALGASGCATTTQVVKDIDAECPQLAGEAIQDLHIIEALITCDGGAGGAALPACALASLGPIAAVIPGNWATIQCIADVIAKDTTKSATVRSRAASLSVQAKVALARGRR